MKGDSAGIEIEINDVLVLNESLAGKANPVHSTTPLKGDVRYDGDEDGSPAAISSNKVLWLQPKTKKLAVTVSVFVFFLFICIGIGIRSSNKNGPTATVNALALQGSDGIAPTVIGGTPLDQGVWQEFRRYLVETRWNDLHICGGTLISSRVVLTAAHCFDTADGTNNFEPSDEIAFNRYDQRLDAGVRTIALCQTEFGFGCDKDDLAYVWRHPDWNTNTINDVALIFLPEAQRISPKFIRPVKLNRNPNVPADGQDLEAFGWGATCVVPFPPDPIVAPATAAPTPTPECIDNTYPNEIQTGNLRYLTNQVCSTLPEVCPITPDMMCAKTDSDRGVSIAFGDSGGPLVIAHESGETLQVGVVSYFYPGPGTITYPDLPNGFARVSFFFDWISSTVCQEVPRDEVFCRGPRAKASKQAKAGN